MVVNSSKFSKRCLPSGGLLCVGLMWPSAISTDFSQSQEIWAQHARYDFSMTVNTSLTNSVSSDDQVKAYIKKIMAQLNKWMVGGKISKLVVVITSKETGEHVERWQFDVQIFGRSKSRSSKKAGNENAIPEYVYFLMVSSCWLTFPGPIKRRQRKRRKRSKMRFKPSSDRLQLQLRSYLFSTETARSMFWSMRTPIPMYQGRGGAVMRKRSRVESGSN